MCALKPNVVPVLCRVGAVIRPVPAGSDPGRPTNPALGPLSNLRL
jgi:hypothetical protein